MTGIYRNDRPSLLFTLPLWAIVPWIGSARRPIEMPEGGGVAYGWLREFLVGHPWSVVVVGILFAAIVAAQCVFLANDADLTGRRGYLPMLLVPVLLACAPQLPCLGPELLAMPFVLWSMRRLWLPTKHGNAEAFNTGLLLGLASLIHFPYCFLLLAVWTTLAVLRPFHWRDHLLPLLGVITVRYLWFGCMQLFATGAHSGLGPVARVVNVVDPGQGYLIALAVVLTSMVVAAVVSFVNGYRRSVMHGKNMRSALLAFTTCCVLLAAFQRAVGGALPIVLLAVPATFLFSAPLAMARRQWLAQAAFVALLALALWAQWGAGLSSRA